MRQLRLEKLQELKHFSKLTKRTEDATKKNAVIMGRKTWESIPERFRPLPGRVNFIITSQALSTPDKFSGGTPCESFEKAIESASQPGIESVWVIGGASIYKAGIESSLLHRIYLTKVLKDFECDTFLPPLPFDRLKQVQDDDVSAEDQCEGDIKYRYEVLENVN